MSVFKTTNSLYRYFINSPQAGPPLRLALTMTDRCNLRCSSCSVWKRDNSQNELSYDEIIRIIDECLELGVKIFYVFGGEPFIRKDFLDVIRYLSEKGMFTETVTNGTLISEEFADRIIDSGLSKIWISIDGPEHTHDRLRGVEGTFDRAYRGLKNICAAKEKKKSDILIDIAVTVSSLNYKNLPEIIDLVSGLPVFEINIRHMGVFFEEDVDNLNDVLGNEFKQKINENDLCFSSGKDIILKSEECYELKTILNECRKKAEILNIPLHLEPGLETITDWRKGKEIKSCMHLWTQININSQGHVIPCLWYDLFSIGDVRKDSIKNIWNNHRYKFIRKNFYKLKACSKCCYFYLDFWSNLKRAFQVINFPFKKLLFK